MGRTVQANKLKYEINIFLCLCVMTMAALAGSASGQDRNEIESTREEATGTFSVEQSEVIYAIGNELVARAATGDVYEITVPDHATALVNGKPVAIADLQPAMKMEGTVATVTTPELISSVHTV